MYLVWQPALLAPRLGLQIGVRGRHPIFTKEENVWLTLKPRSFLIMLWFFVTLYNVPTAVSCRKTALVSLPLCLFDLPQVVSFPYRNGSGAFRGRGSGLNLLTAFLSNGGPRQFNSSAICLLLLLDGGREVWVSAFSFATFWLPLTLSVYDNQFCCVEMQNTGYGPGLLSSWKSAQGWLSAFSH